MSVVHGRDDTYRDLRSNSIGLWKIDLERPRDREDIVASQQYCDYREQLVGFLEERADHRQEKQVAA